MNRIFAWDPGASGAFAWFKSPGLQWCGKRRQWLGCNIGCVGTWVEDADSLIRFLTGIVPAAEMIIYEAQTGFGGSAFRSTAFFEFGRSFGEIIGAMKMRMQMIDNRCKRPKLVGVLPQRWQKTLQLVKSRKEKGRVLSPKEKAARRSEWKRALRDEAIRLYPDCPFRITLDNCDALLLLHYGHKNFDALAGAK